MFGKISNLSKEHRNSVFALILIAGVGCFLGDLFLSSSVPNFLITPFALRAIWTSLLTGGIVAIFTSLFIDKRLERFQVGELRPDEISPELTKLVSASDLWVNNAFLGRWMRSVVLPELSARGGAVTTTLIDPRNDDICSAYGRYRASRKELPDGVGQQNFEKIEVLATIALCSWYASNTHLNIVVYLSGLFNNFRIDGNQTAFVVTQAGKRNRAYKITKENGLFDYFSEHIKAVYAQSVKLQLPLVRKCAISELSEDDLIGIYKNSGLLDVANEVGISVILIAVKKSTNPYPL